MNNYFTPGKQMKLTTLNELFEKKESPSPEFVLKGLLKSHIGMLIAAPGIGKSHLILSIGIEHSAQIKLLGLSETETPKKTLIISSEDGEAILRSRMEEKLIFLSQNNQDILKQNLLFYIDPIPLVVSEESKRNVLIEHKKHIDNLICLIRSEEIDLVIVDTVSESIGNCDEVKHDKIIKRTFQHIARESGASIVLVHHINKGEIRGDQDITMASGAGLSSIMRLTKFLITLKADKKGALSVSYLKSNYLPAKEKKEFPVEFQNNLLVCPLALQLEAKTDHVIPIKLKKENRSKIEQTLRIEPKTIYITAKDTGNDEKTEKRGSLRDVL